HYTKVEGKRAEKLEKLEALQTLDGLAFTDCPEAWDAPFRPEGTGSYFQWPLLTDLMPWQHSGVEAKRTWPIGATREVLEARWKALLASKDRAEALRESTDRVVSGTYLQFLAIEDGEKSIAELPLAAACPQAQG